MTAGNMTRARQTAPAPRRKRTSAPEPRRTSKGARRPGGQSHYRRQDRRTHHNRQERQARPRGAVNYFDYTLVFLVLFLVGFGLLMCYSSSAYTSAVKNNGNTFKIVLSQCFFALIGLLAMYIVSQIDYHIWSHFALLGYVASMGMLIFVTLFGEVRNGAKRWIFIGPLSIQPSEVAKMAMVLFMAYVIHAGVKRLNKVKNLLLYMTLALPIVIIIAIENLSTAIIVFAIVIAMLFVASPRTAPFIIVGAIGLVGGAIAIAAASYRATRILVWLHPEAYDEGYQTMQSLYAIGSGGFFGKGLGQSMQKLGFIPESHNDMIFSIVCEELGIFGAVAVITVFVMLIWRMVIIANNAPDLFGALLVVGIMAQVSMQVIINIAVVTNSIPPTGIPLPFISAGGTSVAILLVEMGMVLGVSKQIKLYK